MYKIFDIMNAGSEVKGVDNSIFEGYQKNIKTFLSSNYGKTIGDGFLVIDEFGLLVLVLKDWLGEGDYMPIFRTAFGHIFYYQKKVQGEILLFDPIYGKNEVITTSYGTVMDCFDELMNSYLVNENILKNVLFYDLFKEAKVKLGVLESTEVYGFEPAISLGGEMKVENMRIYKFREYVEILRCELLN